MSQTAHWHSGIAAAQNGNNSALPHQPATLSNLLSKVNDSAGVGCSNTSNILREYSQMHSLRLRCVSDAQWPVTEPAQTGNVDEGHCAAVNSVVHSRKYIISGGGDCRIRVWAKTTLAHVTTLPGHRGPVFTLLVAGVTPLCARGKN